MQPNTGFINPQYFSFNSIPQLTSTQTIEQEIQKILSSAHLTYTQMNNMAVRKLAEMNNLMFSFSTPNANWPADSCLSFNLLSENEECKGTLLPFMLDKGAKAVNFSNILLPAKIQETLNCNTLQEWVDKEANKYSIFNSTNVNFAKSEILTSFLPVDNKDKKAHFIPTYNPSKNDNWLIFSWSSDGDYFQSLGINFQISKMQQKISESTEEETPWSIDSIPNDFFEGNPQLSAPFIEKAIKSSYNIAMIKLKRSQKSESHSYLHTRNKTDKSENQLISIKENNKEQQSTFSEYDGGYCMMPNSAVFVQIKPLPIDVSMFCGNPEESRLKAYTKKVFEFAEALALNGEVEIYGPQDEAQTIDFTLNRLGLDVKNSPLNHFVYHNTLYLDFTGVAKATNECFFLKQIPFVFPDNQKNQTLDFFKCKPVLVDYANDPTGKLKIAEKFRVLTFNQSTNCYDEYILDTVNQNASLNQSFEIKELKNKNIRQLLPGELL